MIQKKAKNLQLTTTHLWRQVHLLLNQRKIENKAMQAYPEQKFHWTRTTRKQPLISLSQLKVTLRGMKILLHWKYWLNSAQKEKRGKKGIVIFLLQTTKNNLNTILKIFLIMNCTRKCSQTTTRRILMWGTNSSRSAKTFHSKQTFDSSTICFWDGLHWNCMEATLHFPYLPN